MRCYIQSGFLFFLLIIMFAACSESATVSQKPSGQLQPMQTRVPLVDSNLLVDRIMSKLSLEQKIGQLQMVESDMESELDIRLNSYVKNMISGGLPGGILMYNNYFRSDHPGSSVDTNTAVKIMKKLVDDIQAYSQLPMLVSLDQEDANVNRLGYIYKDAPKTAYGMAQTGDPQVPFNQAIKDTQRFKAMGFNSNLAPITDVGTTSNWEQTRLWSSDVKTTVTMAGQYLDALQQNGIMGCLKHWPGIGSLPINANPHNLLPTLDRTADQMKQTEFEPFKQLIAHGPAMIMVTHVMVPR
jgi:beta-N-acetylhexosaminidase